ncbi:MAG: FxsB family cyclophane-forming radical SAM/SPASM peptide maturase [Streptosporangiaceae bacterium]
MSEPVAFSQFVIKVHSRCDLACDICYVYEHADQSWRDRSAVMTTATARRTAERVAEHAVEHGLGEVHVILHGGEPLLAGVERLGEILGEFRSVLAGVCTVNLAVHTNGTMLSRRFCDMFREHGAKVGVSLDGDRAANDQHRVYANGRSSYDRVVRGITLLREEYPDLFSGLLCTVDLANDPITVYEALLSHRPPSVNFLLQHATWDHPPRRERSTDYADWLTPVFDRWHADGRPVRIGFFESILSTVRGGASTVEALGLDPNDVVVIETDGEIEQADSLKTAYDGAPATGLDVFTHSLTEAAAHPEVLSRQSGLDGLAETCRSCPVVQSCGGGLLAHRFSSERGFANPSVYCADLKTIINHVGATLASRTLQLSEFDALAAGLGGRKAAGELLDGQRAIQRVLVAWLTRSDQAARRILDHADLVSRESVARVAAHPVFRAWAVDRIEGRDGPDRFPAFTAAVAVHAGLDADLVVPVRNGEIHLPTIGTYPAVAGEDTVAVRIREGRCELRAAPRRRYRLEADDGFSVALEDGDPDRGLPGWPVGGALSESQAAAWQKMFGSAWNIIKDRQPGHVEGLREMLSMVIPLAGPTTDGENVVTSPRMPGAVALVLPADPGRLADLLVHGFQAMKLAAIQDLVDLHDRSDPGFDVRLRFAYVALAGNKTCPDPGDMSTSSCLTPLGRRFVDGMSAAMRSPERSGPGE